MAGLMRLRVVPTKGEAYEVNITPKVIVAAERQFAKPMTELFGDGASFEALCWTAWQATKYTATPTNPVKPFEEWLDDLDSVEGADEVDRVPLENP